MKKSAVNRNIFDFYQRALSDATEDEITQLTEDFVRIVRAWWTLAESIVADEIANEAQYEKGQISDRVENIENV